LQENGRAKLVGEKTFGKGVIQNLQELRQGGIAVTIAKYETPLHNNINKVRYCKGTVYLIFSMSVVADYELYVFVVRCISCYLLSF
jgi:Peptidase family S41